MTYGVLVSTLKAMKGAGARWQPMYPSFPRQVMEGADAELYFNARMHYSGDIARVLPPAIPHKENPAWHDAA
jgi:hypothetical protein